MLRPHSEYKTTIVGGIKTFLSQPQALKTRKWISLVENMQDYNRSCFNVLLLQDKNSNTWTQGSHMPQYVFITSHPALESTNYAPNRTGLYSN